MLLLLAGSFHPQDHQTGRLQLMVPLTVLENLGGPHDPGSQKEAYIQFIKGLSSLNGP